MATNTRLRARTRHSSRASSVAIPNFPSSELLPNSFVRAVRASEDPFTELPRHEEPSGVTSSSNAPPPRTRREERQCVWDADNNAFMELQLTLIHALPDAAREAALRLYRQVWGPPATWHAHRGQVVATQYLEGMEDDNMEIEEDEQPQYAEEDEEDDEDEGDDEGDENDEGDEDDEREGDDEGDEDNRVIGISSSRSSTVADSEGGN